jgi:hypothetical protein
MDGIDPYGVVAVGTLCVRIDETIPCRELE